MEMVLAFHYKKPIYILHQVSEKLSIIEEVYGMKPIFLDGEISKIKR